MDGGSSVLIVSRSSPSEDSLKSIILAGTEVRVTTVIGASQ